MSPPLATIGAAIAHAAAVLAAAGFDEQRRRARRVIAAALGLSASEIFAYPERILTAAEVGDIEAILDRVVGHEPLSRILGAREFWSLEFALSGDVFEPRPETETVVEAVLARLPDRKRPYCILDLGTGSGCLLLALLSELHAATGLGVDLAHEAAATARNNAARLGMAGRAAFIAGTWAEAVAGPFDIVVSNPPYVAAGAVSLLPPEVRNHDPHRALDGGVDGLDAYRVIIAQLPRLLRPGGLFAAEIGAGQEASVSALLGAQSLIVEPPVKDLAGIARCVVAHRVE